jgi:DNA-binding CsgD family transcriptional regulator
VSTALVEREGQAAAIADAVDLVSGGDGRAVAVTGAAGMGKSRLLDHLATLAAERDFRVVRASGGELECDVAYGVVRQLLERPALDAEEQVLTGAAALARPALGLESVTPPGFGTVEHGVYWLVANLAEQGPLALVIDDAHWADPASLRALVYLVRRLEGIPVLVAVAARDQAAATDPLLGLLVAEAATAQIEATPLSSDGCAELFSQCLGATVASAAAQACHEMSAGNPFLIREIATALEGEHVQPDDASVSLIRTLAPASVRRTLLLRVGRLGEDARAVAAALAVLGDDPDLRVLEAVSGVNRERLLARLIDLAEAGITAPDATARFAHPVIRTALYEDGPVARRRWLHELSARTLMYEGGDAEEIAHHLLMTEPGRDPGVVALLKSVATNASATGATEIAARMLVRALAECGNSPERGELLVAAGEAEHRSGDQATAAEHLYEALVEVSEPRLRRTAALVLSSALAAADDIAAAIDVLEAQIQLVDGEDALALDVQRTALAVWDATRAADAQLRMKEYRTLRGDTPTERLALANTSLALAYDPMSKAADAAGVARRALADGRLITERPGETIPAGMASYVLILAEDHDNADRELESFFLVAQERGSELIFLLASLARCQTALARGELRTAVAHAEAGWTGLRAMDDSAVIQRSVAFGLRFLVEPLLERGELGAVRSVMAEAHEAGFFSRPEYVWARYARGLVRRRHDDDPEGALADFLAVGEAARVGAYEDRNSPWRLEAALAHAAVGDRDSATELVEAQLALARTWGAPGQLGAVLRARALVGDPAEQPERLAEAVEVLRRSECALELARALIDHGTALRRSGTRRSAREVLEQGIDLAARCEAFALVERAREELIVAGARPRRLMFSGIEGMTASERRVAEMAAAGMKNKEIAQTLFVTLKTVEGHLSNVYRKLDITSRAELADRLAADDGSAADGRVS